MPNELEEMAKEFTRWVDAITSDDFRGDVDKVLFKQFFDQALRQVREKTILECADELENVKSLAVEAIQLALDRFRYMDAVEEYLESEGTVQILKESIRKLGGGK